MSNIFLLGFPNYSEQGFVTPGVLDPSFEPADMKAEWLQTIEPTERARLITLDPLYSQWGFETSLVPLQLDALALVNHNIEDGGQVRFLGWDVPASPFNIPSSVSPNSFVSSVNMTGAVTAVDEPISASDGLSIGPTNSALAWSVLLKFPTFTGTLSTQLGTVALVVRVRRVFTGAGATNPLTLPKLTASLGSFSVLGRRAVTVSATGGQIFIFPIQQPTDFATFAREILLSFTPGLSTSGGQHAVLESAAVYYETVSATSPTHDSGWLTVATDHRLQEVAPSQHIHYRPGAAWEGITGYAVQIRSDQGIHEPITDTAGLIPAAVVARDPITFVQAGVAPAGLAIIPDSGIRKGIGPMAGLAEATGFGGSTAGGQSYGADAYSYRSSPSLELIVTRDELRLMQDQLFRRGRHSPFYVAIEPGVALEHQVLTAYWATLKSFGEPRPLGRYKADGSMKFSVEISFQEKL